MFAPHWSVKAEYMFVDLGHFSTTSVDSLDPLGKIDHDHHLTEHLARVGVTIISNSIIGHFLTVANTASARR